MIENFSVTRIYSDSAGDSFFENLSIPLEDNGDIGFLSKAQKCNSIIFRKVSATYDYNFHTAPQRQYIVLLDGQIEIETSLGEIRIFKTGDILLLEDTSGKGHKTRNLKTEVRSSIFITL